MTTYHGLTIAELVSYPHPELLHPIEKQAAYVARQYDYPALCHACGQNHTVWACAPVGARDVVFDGQTVVDHTELYCVETGKPVMLTVHPLGPSYLALDPSREPKEVS